MSKRPTTTEPTPAKAMDPSKPTTREMAVLTALGVNTETVAPHVVADVRASLARPTMPKVRREVRHGHEVTVRVSK